MSMSQLLRVHVHPGLKKVLEDVARQCGQSQAEFVREATRASLRDYLGMGEAEFRRFTAEKTPLAHRRRKGRGRRARAG